jgi:hypothetical protein
MSVDIRRPPSLITRYAARRSGDLERLRKLCSVDSERADRLLTIDFSRYLWASGLAPLIDPPAALCRRAPVSRGRAGCRIARCTRSSGEPGNG